MKNSASDVQKDDKLMKALGAAKKARKRAKSAYKAKLKELKAQLRPLRHAIKEAEEAVKAAKTALKNTVASTAVASSPATTNAPIEKKKPGRKPGAAKAVLNHEEQKAPKATSKAATSGNDDLTQVKGVGENISVMLKANGIKSFADMAATTFERYKELLKANGMSKFRDPSQWAARAAQLANLPAPAPAPKAEPKAKGKPGRKPAVKPATAAPAEKKKPGRPAAPKTTPIGGGDDFTQVKGVGENISVMLKANGIKSFADMAATSFERYKELLKANGMSKFRDPSQWAARAAQLANLPAPAPAPKAEPKAKGKPGRKPAAKPATVAPAEKKKPGRPAAPKAAAAAPPAPQKKQAASKPAVAAPAVVEKKKPGRPAAAPKAAAAAPPAPQKKQAASKPAAKPATKEAVALPKPKAAPAKPDDLTQVKGVGTRVAEVLNKHGIYTYKDMANVSIDAYKEILRVNNMSKFRDPSDWATLAAELAKKK